MSVTEGIAAVADDQLPSSHPVASGAATVSEAIATFDGISYAKGAAVLRQLSAYVGEDNFTTGLRAYLGGHSYGNARLADLVTAVGEASGQDLTGWSKACLETAGPNVLPCEFDTDAAGRLTEFSVVQEASERHPVLRPHRVTVGRTGDPVTRWPASGGWPSTCPAPGRRFRRCVGCSSPT
jgi:aminopeptidase N